MIKQLLPLGELSGLITAVNEFIPQESDMDRLTLLQGGVALNRTNRGVHVVRFVLKPGPDAYLVGLTQHEPRLPVIGHLHKAIGYECLRDEEHPHRPRFDSGRKFDKKDAEALAGIVIEDVTQRTTN